MWRDQGWKLILSLPGVADGAQLRLDEVRGELYDLRADPHEFTNHYDVPEQLARRERMTRVLLMHLASAWARFPGRPSRARLTPVTAATAGH